MIKKKTKAPFFIFIMLFAFPSTSAVLFTPSLPAMAEEFNLTLGVAQWAMTLFLAGLALGYLVYGPLAKRLGRKTTLGIGLFISLIGTLFCVFSENFSFFCIGRLIQGFGSAAGLKIVFTMMGDLYTKEENAKAVSRLMFGFAASQGLGPALGGVLDVFFEWRGCFVFLAFYTVLLFLFSLVLPETAKKVEEDALEVRKIAHSYSMQFKNSFTMLHACLMGLSYSIFYVFATFAPFISMKVIGIRPDYYGFWALLLILGMSAGVLLGNKLIGRVVPRIAMLSGLLLILSGSIAMALFFVKGVINVWTLFFSYLFIQMGSAICYLFASSRGISEAKDKPKASAAIQFVTAVVTVLGTLSIGAFAPKSALSLPILFGIIFSLQLIIWLFLRKGHKKTPS